MKTRKALRYSVNTIEIGAAWLRAVAEIAPKSSFLCVKPYSVYVASVPAYGNWYCVNIT